MRLAFRCLASLTCCAAVWTGSSNSSLLARATRQEHTHLKQAPCASAPDKERSMFVPLGHLRYFGGADLMLNNRGTEVSDVLPTWYVEGRDPIDGPTIHLPASRADFYNIEQFLPSGVRLNQITGLQLSYSGKVREVWAQAILRPARQSQLDQSLDAPFNMINDYKSTRLETVWPIDRPDQRATVALANVGEELLTIHVTGPDLSQTIQLAAHSGTVLNNMPLDPRRTSGWIRLESSGHSGDLRATGFVFDSHNRHPRLIRFFDPAAPVQENLFAAGLPVQGVVLSLSIKNTTTSPVAVLVEVLDPSTGAPSLVCHGPLCPAMIRSFSVRT